MPSGRCRGCLGGCKGACDARGRRVRCGESRVAERCAGLLATGRDASRVECGDSDGCKRRFERSARLQRWGTRRWAMGSLKHCGADVNATFKSCQGCRARASLKSERAGMRLGAPAESSNLPRMSAGEVDERRFWEPSEAEPTIVEGWKVGREWGS